MLFDLDKMSLNDLKALSYDVLMGLGKAQADLQVIDAEIKKRMEPSEPTGESVKPLSSKSKK